MKTSPNLIPGLGMMFGLVLLVYVCFINVVHQYQIGIQRNFFTGQLTLLHSGIYWSSPWQQVVRIDTRPQRVCVTTTGRGFNCKLVQFVPDQFEKFIETEGFRFYWWANRFSINMGYHDEYRGMKDLLRGYAFSIVQYPFITTLNE